MPIVAFGAQAALLQRLRDVFEDVRPFHMPAQRAFWLRARYRQQVGRPRAHSYIIAIAGHSMRVRARRAPFWTATPGLQERSKPSSRALGSGPMSSAMGDLTAKLHSSATWRPRLSHAMGWTNNRLELRVGMQESLQSRCRVAHTFSGDSRSQGPSRKSSTSVEVTISAESVARRACVQSGRAPLWLRSATRLPLARPHHSRQSRRFRWPADVAAKKTQRVAASQSAWVCPSESR